MTSGLLGGGALLLILLILLLSASPNISSLPSAPSRNLTALWPFFQPLSPAALLRLSTLPTSGHQPLLLCASSSCLHDAQKISFPAKQLVLPPLCKDTPLQPFILHHAFYKMVLEKEFPSVLQLVTSLCILYKGPGVLVNPNMAADFSDLLLDSKASRSHPTLIFSRRMEMVFGQSHFPNCPDIESLMKEVMASLDPLPTATSNTTSVIGTSRLFRISTFSEIFDIVEIEGDSFLKVEEEPGCIHYDTFQTDCRRGKKENEDKNCIVNAGNEMQVLRIKHIVHFKKYCLISLEPGQHPVHTFCLLLG